MCINWVIDIQSARAFTKSILCPFEPHFGEAACHSMGKTNPWEIASLIVKGRP
jgi:hypothetical protein